MTIPDYSIVIANWNGAAFIARALAALEAAMREARGRGELIVVDDRSADGSDQIVARRFGWVRLIRNRRNVGYGETTNRGLRVARAPMAILLNNDIVVRADFIRRALAPFDAPGAERLFAVSARTLQWTTGEPNHAWVSGRWRRGWIEKIAADPEHACPTLFVQAGACALRRDVALGLGGLRALYRPGYWEDYDLSYRAARAGWRSLYEPRALAWHLGKASLQARFGSAGVSAIERRNELLFHWANLDDPSMIAEHALALTRHTLGDLLRGDVAALKALTQASARLGEVILARRDRREESSVSDARLLRQAPVGAREASR